jgi:hypothetical protein
VRWLGHGSGERRDREVQLEGPMALAQAAGKTVVAAAVTDAGEAARDGFVRLRGGGDPDQTKLAGSRPG